MPRDGRRRRRASQEG